MCGGAPLAVRPPLEPISTLLIVQSPAHILFRRCNDKGCCRFALGIAPRN